VRSQKNENAAGRLDRVHREPLNRVSGVLRLDQEQHCPIHSEHGKPLRSAIAHVLLV
jgi:hypothetical protein